MEHFVKLGIIQQQKRKFPGIGRMFNEPFCSLQNFELNKTDLSA